MVGQPTFFLDISLIHAKVVAVDNSASATPNVPKYPGPYLPNEFGFSAKRSFLCQLDHKNASSLESIAYEMQIL